MAETEQFLQGFLVFFIQAFIQLRKITEHWLAAKALPVRFAFKISEVPVCLRTESFILVSQRKVFFLIGILLTGQMVLRSQGRRLALVLVSLPGGKAHAKAEQTAQAGCHNIFGSVFHTVFFPLCEGRKSRWCGSLRPRCFYTLAVFFFSVSFSVAADLVSDSAAFSFLPSFSG